MYIEMILFSKLARPIVETREYSPSMRGLSLPGRTLVHVKRIHKPNHLWTWEAKCIFHPNKKTKRLPKRRVLRRDRPCKSNLKWGGWCEFWNSDIIKGLYFTNYSKKVYYNGGLPLCTKNLKALSKY